MKKLYGHGTTYPYTINSDGYGYITDDGSIDSIASDNYRWAYEVGLLSPDPRVVGATLDKIIEYGKRLPGHSTDGQYFFNLRWASMRQWNISRSPLESRHFTAETTPLRYDTREAAIAAQRSILRMLESRGSVERALDMIAKEEAWRGTQSRQELCPVHDRGDSTCCCHGTV